MASIQSKAKRRKFSKKEDKRFYTAIDMAIVKHDIAVTNAKRNRGELDNFPNQVIFRCGCGMEGCFLHLSRKTEI